MTGRGGADVAAVVRLVPLRAPGVVVRGASRVGTTVWSRCHGSAQVGCRSLIRRCGYCAVPGRAAQPRRELAQKQSGAQSRGRSGPGLATSRNSLAPSWDARSDQAARPGAGGSAVTVRDFVQVVPDCACAGPTGMHCRWRPTNAAFWERLGEHCGPQMAVLMSEGEVNRILMPFGKYHRTGTRPKCSTCARRWASPATDS